MEEKKSKGVELSDDMLDTVSGGKDDKKIIPHVVNGNDTVESLAEKYNTSGDAILQLNPELSNGLKNGTVVVIPLNSNSW